MIKDKLLLAMLLSSGVAGACLGAAITKAYYTDVIQKMQIDINNEEIARLNASITAAEASITEVNGKYDALQILNTETQAKLETYEKANTTLARNLADGTATARVRIVPQACPSSPKDGAAEAGVMGNDATAELDPVARQDYLALRLGIQRESEKVSYLQEFIQKNCQ